MGLSVCIWTDYCSRKNFFFVGTGEASRKERNLLILPNAQRNYVDLVRASDVIVSKPGYGIVADVIRHQVPLLYTDRGDFAEYPYLVKTLEDCATAEFIPQDDLISANLTPYLKRLLTRKKHWPPVAINGASVASRETFAPTPMIGLSLVARPLERVDSRG